MKTRRIRVEDLGVDHFGVGIINICMNTSIRSPRETKTNPAGELPPPADVDDSNAERIDVENLDPNSRYFRGVESVFGASKNRKSKDAQNRILDIRL